MRGVRVGAGLVACWGLFAMAGCASSSQGPGGSVTATDTASASSQGPGGGVTATASASARAASTADLPAPEILTKARAAGAGATSFTMTFAFAANQVDPGQPRLSGRLSWDRSGHCVGRITLQGHGDAALVASGGTTWLKPDAAFARAEFGPAAAAALNGKYVKGPTADPHFADFSFPTADGAPGDLCQYGLNLLSIPAEADESTRKLGTTTIHGIRVVEIQPVGKGSSVAFVAAEGTPYLIQAGEGPGVDFSDYGRPVVATLPPDSLTVAVSKLPRR